MEYRQLGQTGVFVSRLCLGTMTFGGNATPPWSLVGGLDLIQARSLVDVALDHGVNFIDTANVYASGESETLLGQALGARRRDVILATKFGSRMGMGPNEVGQSRLHIMRAIEDSLGRLGTDCIDLYQIHNFDPFTPPEETLRALDDAVTQGKVRYIGCSNLFSWQVVKALGLSALQNLSSYISVQSYYSLAGRDVEDELIPMALDRKLALLCWSPLAGGFLSGKFGRSMAESDDSRRTRVDFPPVDRDKTYDIIDVLKTVAARHSVSAARVALAWVLSRPAVTSVIIGARKIDQLVDNLRADGLRLGEQDLAELDAVSKQPQRYPAWLQTYSQPGRMPQPRGA